MEYFTDAPMPGNATKAATALALNATRDLYRYFSSFNAWRCC
jgi:hypothetical protein